MVSGDISQRGRHGEFQRGLAFLERMQETAPTLLVPGNHDVLWWRSPFGLLGRRRLYAKYRTYFGEELTPVLRLPGVVVAGALSAHGLAAGSLTWNQRDLTVKGHLPKSETDRLAALFAAERRRHRQGGRAAPQRAARGHLPADGPRALGERPAAPRRHRRRRGALRARPPGRRGPASASGTVVSTAGTLTDRSRGQRPSVFNVVRIDQDAVHVAHWRWDKAAGEFRPADSHAFARTGVRHGVVGAGRVA